MLDLVEAARAELAAGDAWDVATTQAPPLSREWHAARARAHDATRDATRDAVPDAVRDAAPVPPLSALWTEWRAAGPLAARGVDAGEAAAAPSPRHPLARASA